MYDYEPIDLDALEPDWVWQAGSDFPPVASRAEKVLRLMRELRAARRVVEAARIAAAIYKCYDCDAPEIMNKAIAAYDATVTNKSNPE